MTGRKVPGPCRPAVDLGRPGGPPVSDSPATTRPDRLRRLRQPAAWAPHLFLAAVAYVPLLLTKPGQVGSDTKQYLYLDPGRLMSRALSMWDPHIAMGTVSHQTIGYLFPMGPYYWVLAHLGSPVWVAQRIWLASLLFAAGAGTLFLLRSLERPRPGAARVGATVAALAYMLSPYLLAYEARLSALLMPWAGLPWLVGLTARGVRRGGWRHPAAFAVVVAVIGGVNASSLIYAGIGPVLWVLWAVVTGEAGWRRALWVAAKIGVLSALVSLWWIAGLAVEGGYGMDILRYTESVKTVARTSTAAEAVRGLGYWYFYGQDKLGLYLPVAAGYMTSLWLIAVSFAVPALAFVAAVAVRWRHRAYFVALVVVGTILSVGAHPFDHPSPIGAAFKATATGTTAGFALRSTNRAVPLIVLGIAVFLGAGVTALITRLRVAGVLAAVIVAGLGAADLPPLWLGQMVAPNLARAENIPNYWNQVAAYLDRGPHDTRVLALPGIDFAAYRWGDTVDPVLPGLMDRPFVARELVPYGSPASVNLLGALDRPLQEGTFEPSGLAPLARMMSVGEVLIRSDLQYERYNTPRPRPTWQLFSPSPPGLGDPVGFGDPAVTAARPDHYPLIDETELGLPEDAPYPPPVALEAVPDARPILRAESGADPVVVDGDGEGLVALAPTGLLGGDPTVLYSPSLTPGALSAALDSNAALVVTDTNRRQAQRWGTVRENLGYTEAAGEQPITSDPTDARLPLFPGQTDTSRTVAQQRGVKSIRASDYGNPITYTPENRAANAMDGNLETAWTVAAFDDPVGQYLEVRFLAPVTTDQVNLVQPLVGPRNRWITTATLTFDGGQPVTVALGDSSRTPTGQTVTFPTRTFSTLRIRVDGTNTGKRSFYGGLSGVGFAEVRVADQRVDEVLRMPVDLLKAAGADSLSHRLTLVMSRWRAPTVPPRTDPEVDLARTFNLPTARTFSVSGTARISALVPDDVIDRLLGSAAGGVVAYSSGRLPGDVRARASATIDGDPTTVWSPGLGPQDGAWLEYDLAKKISFHHLDLTVVADGRHSVPTRLRIDTDTGSRTVDLPAVNDSTTPWATTTIPVDFAALSGRRVRLTFEAVRPVKSTDYYSGQPIELPLGVAEVRLPGLHARPTPGELPGTCRDDLLSVDGRPVPLRITGDTQTAQQLGGLAVSPCGWAAQGIALGPGDHVVRTTPGHAAGVDVDRLVLDSAPYGAPEPAPAPGAVPPAASAAAPSVSVAALGTTTARLVVHQPQAPFWVVLGESQNAGWHARVEHGPDLGPPQIVDGYANGWLVRPVGGGDVVVDLSWAPQRGVWAALAVSAVALLGCLAMALWPGRRRRLATAAVDVPEDRLRLVGGGRARRAPLPAALAAAVVAGGLAAAAVRPWVGAPVAVAALAGALLPYGRLLPALGAVGLLGATGWTVVAGQATHHYVDEFAWPTNFETAALLAGLAVFLLAADAAAEAARRRWRPWRATPVADQPPPEPVEPAAVEEAPVGAAAEARGAGGGWSRWYSGGRPQAG